MKPLSYAAITAWTRSRAPSFASTLRTCVFTVSTPRNSSRAISALDRLCATSRRTLALASGEVRRCDLPAVAAVAGREPADGRGEEQGLAVVHCADRVDEVLRGGALQQEPPRPGLQRVVDVVVVLERGHDDDRRAAGVKQRRDGATSQSPDTLNQATVRAQPPATRPSWVT